MISTSKKIHTISREKFNQYTFFNNPLHSLITNDLIDYSGRPKYTDHFMELFIAYTENNFDIQNCDTQTLIDLIIELDHHGIYIHDQHKYIYKKIIESIATDKTKIKITKSLLSEKYFIIDFIIISYALIDIDNILTNEAKTSHDKHHIVNADMILGGISVLSQIQHCNWFLNYTKLNDYYKSCIQCAMKIYLIGCGNYVNNTYRYQNAISKIIPPNNAPCNYIRDEQDVAEVLSVFNETPNRSVALMSHCLSAIQYNYLKNNNPDVVEKINDYIISQHISKLDSLIFTDDY
jgi:hypothetical protein